MQIHVLLLLLRKSLHPPVVKELVKVYSLPIFSVVSIKLVLAFSAGHVLYGCAA